MVAIDLAEQYKKNTNQHIELDLFIAQSWDKSYFLCSVCPPDSDEKVGRDHKEKKGYKPAYCENVSDRSSPQCRW